MGIGVDNGRIDLAIHIAGLVLLGKDHRHAHFQGHRRRNGNAGGLNGQNLIDTGIGIKPCKFLGHLAQEGGIDLLIQEGTHLEDTAGQDLALFQDFLFHCLHMQNAPFQIKKTADNYSPRCKNEQTPSKTRI